MDHTAKPSRFVGALSLAAAAALALSACASDSKPSESSSPSNDSASVAASPTESNTATESATGGETSTETKAGDNKGTGDDKFEDVVKVAEGEVSGSKAIDYEFDEGDGKDTYEIDVVDADKFKHEIDIDADAKTVTKNEKDKALDGDDLKEFDGAKVSIVDAVKSARGEAAENAVVDEVDLDWDKTENKAVWEVKFKDGTTETKVKVDAGSGDVISK